MDVMAVMMLKLTVSKIYSGSFKPVMRCDLFVFKSFTHYFTYLLP